MCGDDDGRMRFADDINAIVVAHAFLGSGDEALGLVGPEDDEVVALALFPWLVEETERVRIEEHLEEGVNVAPLGLELLRHRYADDFAAVDVGEVERIGRWTEDLGNVWRDECLEVVRDGFFHSTDLLGPLVELPG